jgi:hypothetical protein
VSVVKLVNTTDLKSVASYGLRVQVPPLTPIATIIWRYVMSIIDDLMGASRQPSPNTLMSGLVRVPRGLLVKAAERIAELEVLCDLEVRTAEDIVESLLAETDQAAHDIVQALRNAGMLR